MRNIHRALTMLTVKVTVRLHCAKELAYLAVVRIDGYFRDKKQHPCRIFYTPIKHNPTTAILSEKKKKKTAHRNLNGFRVKPRIKQTDRYCCRRIIQGCWSKYYYFFFEFIVDLPIGEHKRFSKWYGNLLLLLLQFKCRDYGNAMTLFLFYLL